MKNISVQKGFGWCTVHTLANVLRDEEFKEYLSNDEYKSCDISGCTDLLKHTGYQDFYMRSIIDMQSEYPTIPLSFVMEILLSDNKTTISDEKIKYPIIPYFLTVRKKTKHWHYVAVIKHYNDYFYIDPYFEDIIKLPHINYLMTYFNECNGIERICRDTKIQNMIEWSIFYGEKLGFDKLIANK